MKKIAIDCRVLNWTHSGMARYLDNILTFLSKEHADNVHYYLLSPNKKPVSFKWDSTKFTWVYLKGIDALYKFIKTPLFLKKEKIDIYWSPTQDLPFWKPSNCIYISSIHDIAYEHYKNWFNFQVNVLIFLGYYKYSAKLADYIFSISQFTKEDIIKTYRFSKSDENKIIVTYEGVDDFFKPLDKDTARKYIQDTFKINFHYIFYIDTVRSEKLLRAFAKLVHNEWRNDNVKLVCLGKFTDQSQSPEYLSEKFNIRDRVVHIKDYISDLDLNNFYSGSEFFVSPSFYEGFGLTPLEALRSGTPVLISNVTCLPEIFQDAALYCEPSNIADIENKMKFLYNNIKERNEILNNSKKLFDVYNWNVVGEKVKKIFNII